jgi:hypothetical protein
MTHNEMMQATSRGHTIMKMQKFAASEEAKPDTENLRSLNLTVVKRTTVQVVVT